MVKEKNRNVLHIASYAAVYRGNFIESLEALTKKLCEHNIETEYMLPQTAKELDWVKALMGEGRKIDFMSGDILKDAAKIGAIIRENNIGIVHTHFISMKQYMAVYFGCLGTKAKIFMHFHNHSQEAFGIKDFLRKRLYGKCVMVACSKSVYDILNRDYPNNKKYRVDNCVFFDRLGDVRTIDRKEYSIAEDSKICLIFGFDFYRKGVDLAIEAIDKLNRDKKEKIELLISLSKNFEKVQEEIVKILGEMPSWVHIIRARNDIASLYELCDVFLSPSREEGLCYSAVEAEYCSCSVVISDIPSQGDLILPMAVHADADNVESLREGIKTALDRKTEKISSMDKIRETLKDVYNIENWSSGLIRAYEEVLGID